MREAAKLFYLAVFSLMGVSHAASPASSSRAPTKSKSPPPNVCDFEPGAIVSDACASYSTLEELNVALHPYLHSITQNTDFFSHYRLNLYNKKCPFWSEENGMCGNIACAVNTLENEDDIPLIWRAHELGKLEGPTAKHPGRKQQQEKPERPLQGRLGENVGESCVVEYDDECDERDYCIPEDERASSKGDYVSLVGNPERFTGYAGAGSQQVWEAIYRENCFSKPSPNAQNQGTQSQFGDFSPFQQQASQDLRMAMQSQGLQQSVQSAIAHNTVPAFSPDPVEFDDECLEKRVFYRVISGMHASISTHICWEHLNQTTGEWAPNLACYEDRLHAHPDRISNLYFNYALILRAVGKIKRHIKDYSFCTADPEQDQLTRNMVLKLADRIPSGPDIFDETIMFQDPSTTELKEDFRNRFRNVSRIMDCVGCDKCRLWGKLQTAGYGTALKVLFEFDEKDSSNDPPLRRTELVALINTMDRLSHSLNAVQEFRRRIDERDHGVSPADPEFEPELEPFTLDDDEAEFEKARNVTDEEQSFMDVFWEEWTLVWKAYAYVLKSWIAFPGKAFEICVSEFDRLWNWWLGLPVQPRSWRISLPRKEEL